MRRVDLAEAGHDEIHGGAGAREGGESPDRVDALRADCAAAGEAVQEIGQLVDEQGVVLIHPDGRVSTEIPDGFDHFRA